MPGAKKLVTAIHWFRKGQRLHDNPSLMAAINAPGVDFVFPLFVIDPEFANPDKVGVNRYRFLLESLADLDAALRPCNSRLFVVKGKPTEVIPRMTSELNAAFVSFESDTEPYAKLRDDAVVASVSSIHGEKQIPTTVKAFCSHTLYDPEMLLGLHTAELPPTVYQQFLHLLDRAGPPQQPSNTREELQQRLRDKNERCARSDEQVKKWLSEKAFNVPTLEEMGYPVGSSVPSLFPGGETAALQRLHATVTNQEDYVQNFSKPNTSPNSLQPSTTVLSPYLKFGCLSPRFFWAELQKIERKKGMGKCTKPPVSLKGQLLWREFYYLASYGTPNYHSMNGNPSCRKIDWDNNPDLLKAWEEGRTGYPWIDALMTQLREEGWMHHLGRHAVACFLTRGDLYQSWEKGAQVFDRLLLDADYALNVGNWMWLSASCYFHQYFRVYSPISFGKKTDPNGDFIRKYLPRLARFPKEYIYEPWKAPIAVQKSCGCIIGNDYPKPIVDHAVASAKNMKRMAAAFSSNRGAAATPAAPAPAKGPPKKRPRDEKEIVTIVESSSDSDSSSVRAIKRSPRRRKDTRPQ